MSAFRLCTISQNAVLLEVGAEIPWIQNLQIK